MYEELYFESTVEQDIAYRLLARFLNKMETARRLKIVVNQWRLKNLTKDHSHLTLVVNQ